MIVRRFLNKATINKIKMMRAIKVPAFGGPEVLKVDQNALIPEPGANQILINVKAISINPVETYMRSGQYARLPTLPFIPGKECSGVVTKIGPGVTKVKPDDKVYSFRNDSGTYAEYVLCQEDNCNLMPEILNFAESACLGITYHTAYRAMNMNCVLSPNRQTNLALIHGASGGVGTAAVQLCKMNGIKVVGTAGTSEGNAAVLASGAEKCFNHREKGYVEQLKEYANSNGGFDLIVENAGNINLDVDLDLVAAKGRIIIIGSRGMNTISVVPRKFMAKECIVAGVMLFNSTKDEFKESGDAILAGVKNGALKPVIGCSFNLDQTDKAHELLMSDKGARGQIVLIP